MDDSKDTSQPMIKSRAHGAVECERMQLLCIIAHHWEELERCESEGGNQKQKWDLWELIASEFNCHPNVTITRTPLQVKTLFKNMKTKARKYKIKIETSKESGILVDADPVSETLLNLTDKFKGSVKKVLENLKNLYYDYNARSGSPLNEYLFESPESADLNKAIEDHNVASIKEETVESLDSPCIINGSIAASSDTERHDESGLDLSVTPKTLFPIITLETPAEVHTFGDLSVTPLIAGSEKMKNALLTIRNFSELPDKSDSIDSVSYSNSLQSRKSKNSLKRTFSDAEGTVVTNMGIASLESLNAPKGNLNKTVGLNCTTYSSGSCCCPEYHSRMLSMSSKEHELRMSLLSEEIISKREENTLKAEERRIRELEFLMKQEERQARCIEHKARLKLLELECQAIEKQIKNNEKKNTVNGF